MHEKEPVYIDDSDTFIIAMLMGALLNTVVDRIELDSIASHNKTPQMPTSMSMYCYHLTYIDDEDDIYLATAFPKRNGPQWQITVRPFPLFHSP